MSKKLLVGDLHFGANESSPEYIEYRDYSCSFIIDVAKRYECDEIIFLGDLFHNSKFVTPKTVQDYKDFLDAIPGKIKKTGILGNHDKFYKNTNALNYLDIFGMMDEVITDAPTVRDNIILCPWINPENLEVSVTKIKNTEAEYCLGHFEMKGFEMLRGLECKESITPAEIFHHFKQVYSGHFHLFSRKKNFCYLGSAVEVNWSDCDEPKYYAVFDTETGEETLVQNPFTFYRKVVIDTDTDLLDVDALKGKNVKLVVNCERTKKLDKLIDYIAESVREVKVINNFEISTKINGTIVTENLDFLDMWREYLASLTEVDEVDKAALNEIFENAYRKVSLV